MRAIARNISLYAFSLFAIQLLFAGVVIRGGISTYVVGGIVLTVLFFTLKPLLQLLAFPINLATLGLFTVLINTLILYVATVVIPNITITSFLFSGFSFLGFIIPKIAFNVFFAYVICAIVISCITSAITWLFRS